MRVVNFEDLRIAREEEMAHKEVERFIIEQFIPNATHNQRMQLIESFETKNNELFESLIRPAYMRYYIRVVDN